MRVQLCPACGSGKVSVNGEHAECKDCDWKGAASAVLVTEYERGLDTPTAVLEDVCRIYFLLLGKLAAVEMGRAMIESGLVGRKDTALLTRLIRAACMGAYRGTLDEMSKIEKELQNERRQEVH